MKRRAFLKSAAAMSAAALSRPAQASLQGQEAPPGKPSYELGSDSKPQPGVPAGKCFSFTMDRSRLNPGTSRSIDVFVPAQYTVARPACVWIALDGLRPSVPAVLDNLIHAKELPVMIAVGLHPGTTPSANAAENPRFNRSFEFDSLTGVLADFILEEMLPAVEQQKTPDGLPILLSHDGNDCGITGASSGGIGAFTAAWQRPDAFRRVYSMIGTFVGMRGGDRYPVLVRKTEPKPLRVFLQDNDKDGWPGGLELGDWWMGNQEMERALNFAGYAVNHAWQSGGHDRHQGESILPDVMRWLWKDWPTPVEPGQTSNFALAAILEPGQAWKDALPEAASSRGNEASHSSVYASAAVVTETSTAACLASDAHGSVYFHNPSDGGVYRVPAEDRIERYRQASPGDNGIAFGPDGRLYVVESRTGKLLASAPGGRMETIAEGIRGHRLTVTSTGDIYVTEGGKDDSYAGKVWLVRPGSKPAIVADGLNGPSGICMTPDGLWLCVADAAGHHAWSYRVQPDGTLQEGEPFYWFHVPDAASNSGASQVCMDREGWAYAATRMGVQVFDRNGRVTAILPVEGKQLAGLCFGGADFQTLYVSTGDAVYWRRIKKTGMPAWEKPGKLPPWGEG